MLRTDFPVSGGLVEDDHHARTREDSVFCHLVAVSVHVTFVYRRRHTFYPCAPFHVCHVWWSAWLVGPNSARVVFPQMLEIVCDWWSLYARHTVEKLGLIAPLRQASHFRRTWRDWNCTCARNATERPRTARGGLAAGHQHSATPASSHANIFIRRLFRQRLPIFCPSECMTKPPVSDIKHTRALQATFIGHDSSYRHNL